MNKGRLVVTSLGRALNGRRRLLLRLSRRSRAVLVPGGLLGLDGLWLLLLLVLGWRSLLLELLGLLGPSLLSLELGGRLLRWLLLLRGRLPPRALLSRRCVTALRLPLLRCGATPTVLGPRGLLTPRLLLLLLWLERLLRLLNLLRLLVVDLLLRLLLVSRLLRLLRLLLVSRLLVLWLLLVVLRRRVLCRVRRLLLRRCLRPLLRRGLLLRRRLLVLLGLALLLGRLAPRSAALAPVATMRCELPLLRSSLGRPRGRRLTAVRDTAVLSPAAGGLTLLRRLLLGLRRLLLGLSGSKRAPAGSEGALARLGRRRAVLSRVHGLLKVGERAGTGRQPGVVGVEGAGVRVVLERLLRRVLLVRRRRSLPKVLLGGSRLRLLRSVFTSLALSADFLDLVGPLL